MGTIDDYAATYKVLITCVAARIPGVLWGPPTTGACEMAQANPNQPWQMRR